MIHFELECVKPYNYVQTNYRKTKNIEKQEIIEKIIENYWYKIIEIRL